MLFTRTMDLVQRLQTARQNLTLAQDVAKLDKFHLLILDDLSYVQKDHAETSVLFELIAARYERRSIMITANQPFGGWDGIFPDKAMTVAAIDRLRPSRRHLRDERGKLQAPCGPRARDIETRHSQRHPKRTTEKGHLSLSQIGPGVSSSLDPETTHGHAQNSAVDTSPTMSLTIHQRCRATITPPSKASVTLMQWTAGRWRGKRLSSVTASVTLLLLGKKDASTIHFTR